MERCQKLAFAEKLPEQKNPDQANPIFRMESGMAYISQRGAYWRAEIRRHGYKPVYRTFDTKQQAQQWIHRVESEMDAGLLIDRTEAETPFGLNFRSSATSLKSPARNGA